MPMLRNILSSNAARERPSEVRLAAASALLALGAPTTPILSIAKQYVSAPDARVRAQAAVLLGKIATNEAAVYLKTLRMDPDATVRLCASAASLSALAVVPE